MTRNRDADLHLPLTPPMLHTLLALADGDKHGYAIIKEIARRTDGAVRLSAGTLYALVKRALASTASSPRSTIGRTRRSTTNGAGTTG